MLGFEFHKHLLIICIIHYINCDKTYCICFNQNQFFVSKNCVHGDADLLLSILAVGLMDTKSSRIKIPFLKDDKEKVLENLMEGYMLVFRILKLEEMVNRGDQITSTLKQLSHYTPVCIILDDYNIDKMFNFFDLLFAICG